MVGIPWGLAPKHRLAAAKIALSRQPPFESPYG